LSSVACRSELGSKAVLPLRTFIQETLRRSRTSYSTLQVALYYLILIKPHVPKHDFTMEQPDDRQSGRALQCGRRMFLAALILASKYLQDRNYSARAWSKISGLPTFEINQNEIAFLLAVNWKLHIADEVFQRWTEIVLNYTPPPAPPSPDGTTVVVTQQALEWKRIILKLNVELTNIDGLAPRPHLRSRTSDLSLASPRSILNNPLDGRSDDSADDTPTPRAYGTPAKLAPITTSAVPSLTRPALALGLLPTPRLTPQSNGFCTPAAGAAPQSLAKSNAMGLAMAQANTTCAAQYMDRMPPSVTSSPQCYFTARRSSLANMSITSSPESMMSDTSRSSRSSSICSVSSLASATMSSKLSLPSRFRATKTCNERLSMRPSVPSVPEDYQPCLTSSPEYYSGPIGRDDMAHDAVSDAARALQELHASASGTPTPRAGSKRSCPGTWENPLQDNVRELLNTRTPSKPTWPNTLARTRGVVSESLLQIPMRSDLSNGRKRVCCASEAVDGFGAATVHPAIGGIRGPGMWEGILN
jgi:hypothetical protein